MTTPMDPLPTSPDDPRLDGWYHTIELAGTRHPCRVGPPRDRRQGRLPRSLKGKTALDVGTANGFWAFEMEGRGAEKVVAIDIGSLGDVDLIPAPRAATCPPEVLENRAWQIQFATARAMLGSKVEQRTLGVYDLSPETAGVVDVVYRGSLLIHLFNPLQALINIRSVTKEVAVVETTSFRPPRPDPAAVPRPPLHVVRHARQGWKPARPQRGVLEFHHAGALCDMLIYAGFAQVEPLEPFLMRRAGTDGAVPVTSVIAHVNPDPAVQGWYRTRARPSSLVSTDYRLDRQVHAPRPLWRRRCGEADGPGGPPEPPDARRRRVYKPPWL
ncbi:MAG: hypothetical protein U0835_24920 [Isosphaeraceae bacterium]